MARLDLAYMAGVFDGEGCITINCNRKGYKVECLVVTAGAYIPTLFHFNFGGNLRKRKSTVPHWHDYYR